MRINIARTIRETTRAIINGLLLFTNLDTFTGLIEAKPYSTDELDYVAGNYLGQFDDVTMMGFNGPWFITSGLNAEIVTVVSSYEMATEHLTSSDRSIVTPRFISDAEIIQFNACTVINGLHRYRVTYSPVSYGTPSITDAAEFISDDHSDAVKWIAAKTTSDTSQANEHEDYAVWDLYYPNEPKRLTSDDLANAWLANRL